MLLLCACGNQLLCQILNYGRGFSFLWLTHKWNDEKKNWDLEVDDPPKKDLAKEVKLVSTIHLCSKTTRLQILLYLIVLIFLVPSGDSQIILRKSCNSHFSSHKNVSATKKLSERVNVILVLFIFQIIKIKTHVMSQTKCYKKFSVSKLHCVFIST